MYSVIKVKIEVGGMIMTSINDVIAMKKQKSVPFETQYHWLIQTIENDLISKSNGSERVRQLLSDYDLKAKILIVHQFNYIGQEHLARELLSIFEININETFLEDEYFAELIDL